MILRAVNESMTKPENHAMLRAKIRDELPDLAQALSHRQIPGEKMWRRNRFL